jgi:hypothetical protein
LGKKEGGIAFDEIRGAKVDMFWMSGAPGYRPVLSTSQGTFPLLNYYTGGDFTKRDYEPLVAAINTALKADGASAMEDEILELVAQGQNQRLAAIRMVQQRYGYDLHHAQQFVDALRQRLSSEPKPEP